MIQSSARSFGMEVSPVGARDAAEIEHAIKAFLRPELGGLIVTGSAFGVAQRDLLVSLAARYRLPAVYPFRYFVSGGGLVSYGPNTTEQYRQAAGYVDRILKGEKPGNLPVQASTKYDLVINLKTAKALGLDLPSKTRARADEVVESPEGDRLTPGDERNPPRIRRAPPTSAARSSFMSTTLSSSGREE